tara:strand:- start:2067 stop:2630 length:564 start_codon:yes stop_codon:yes gene_type:complete
MQVSGIKEVEAALNALRGRQRQNIERKAARASMNYIKKGVQKAWKNVSVTTPTKPVSRSIRRAAAKATTVKVGTKKLTSGEGYGVYGRVYLNYNKKKAGRARLAHLLEWGHQIGGATKKQLADHGGVDPAKRLRLQRRNAVNFSRGHFPTTRYYHAHKGIARDLYMKAVLAWITNPKMTQKQARETL